MAIIDKVKTAARIGCIMGGFALWPGTSEAAVITTGCANVNVSCTLAELFGGSSMEVNNGYSDLLFHNFLQELLQTTGPAPNYNVITVTGLDTGAEPGFQINGNGQLVITNTDYLALNIGFKVECIGHPCDDNSLWIDATATGSGHVKVDEDVFDSNGIYQGSKHTEIYPPFGINVLYDHLEFPKTPDLIIEKKILLEGFAPGDTAQIFSITQTFSVPEPATTALFGVGLAGVWLTRRRVGKA